MKLVPHMPQKVQYLLQFSFPLVKQLTQKTATEQFVGGRPGYDKETLFGWLRCPASLHSRSPGISCTNGWRYFHTRRG